MLNVLNGGALSYAISTTPAERTRAQAEGTTFAGNLVAFALAGLGLGSPPGR